MKDFFAWCRRYLSFTLVGALAIGALVLFFNENSVLRTVEQERRIAELKASIKDAADTLEHYRALNLSLRNDRETMERIVREQYHMQQTDEDVYVFQ
ncbi:MAG: septum formation initiator family protein [Duncaniella sp.]|nr:septum formation initiator family protein [Duncaniella sp.]MDE5735183.1 septum formation initiator family protein [Duncaniella sp.]MDE6177802.1 septum formation initiator family protein [Duncaniella sp.]MDE6390616.1 septum formation initiator family protein [Duncaniella sp.]